MSTKGGAFGLDSAAVVPTLSATRGLDQNKHMGIVTTSSALKPDRLPALFGCGFCLLALLNAFVGPLRGSEIIVNEIHYAPDAKTEQVEFIELYNRSTNLIHMSGWRFTAGIEFAFPVGATVAPGGFVVVAQNPVALNTKFGVTAFGPWAGWLDNQGETLELCDAAGTVLDRVSYRLGFPWPTVGDPPGYSIELVNPTADNDLGGHWRASLAGGSAQSKRLVLSNSAAWRYRKGTGPPPTGWREPEFDDSNWDTGEAPIGYDPNIKLGTPLNDMRGNYVAVFMRGAFELTNAAVISGVELESLYDDGFKLWINGRHIKDVNMDNGEVPYDRPARVTRESDNFELVDVTLPSNTLREGRNVVAVQFANGNLGSSSDCFFDCRLRVVVGPSGRGPTPGRMNAAYSAHIPPALRQVAHAPRQPVSGEPVQVTIKATSKTGISSVTLEYQVLDPGGYIELSDPAYATQWTALPMNDAGLDGDAVAGDDVHTATLPGAVQRHRRLVRYRITATDVTGAKAIAPTGDDPEPNFAFFCYDSVPAWTGAVRPGVTAPFTVSASEMNRLPVYHLIAKKKSVEDCTWYDRSHGDEYFWQGTLVYDGRVYDHVRFRPRGGVWRYAMGKNMWKFDFNRGHDFEARDNWGRKFDVAWTKLNLGANIQQGDYLHRGEQGMFESVGFRLFQIVGVPAMDTAFVQFRIIDEIEESSPSDQYRGDFWGLYLAVEQPDGRFLDAHNLPDGNLYKMESGMGEPNNLGPTGPVDGSDLRAFMSAYNSNPAASWWRTNFHLTSYYGYQAIVQAIHHYDIADGKNYFYYRNPENGVWWVIPWDLDLTWADNMYRGGQQGGDEPFKSRVLSSFSSNPRYPDIAREFRNRVREIRDLLWNSEEAFKLIDEYARLLRGTENPSIIDADRAQWDYNPVMTNTSIVLSSKAGVGRFYQQGHGTKDFDGMVRLMKDYVGYRATNSTFSLDTICAEAGIPATPLAAYAGLVGYPVNHLAFRASPFGGTAFASVKWRLAEVTPPDQSGYSPSTPWQYEITPVWESAELTAQSDEFEFPPGVARVGHAYRARVRYTDTVGRTSHWSLPVEFVAGPPDRESLVVDHLRISELMFHPLPEEAFEFIELHNDSATETLDIGGATFTDGIEYVFPQGTALPPGGYLLLVHSDPANQFQTFRVRYGLDAAAAIVGPYTGSVRNEGEKLTLKTAQGGLVVFSFTYNNSRDWPIAAQGAGHSIVPLPVAMTGAGGGLLEYGWNWRASAYRGGSPGVPDPDPPRTLILSELMASTVYESTEHPEYTSNDWIELCNASDAPVSTAGWYLSDDAAALDKWPLPPVWIPPNSYVVFDEVTAFHSPITAGFELDQAGEELYLAYLAGGRNDRVADAVRFKGQEQGFSWGREPCSMACWRRLSPTRGLANSPPPDAPVVTEIMYHPYDLAQGTNRVDNTRDEFIEIWNPSAFPWPLTDAIGAWRLDGGVSYLFPPNTVIPPNGRVLVVGFDPSLAAEVSAFRRRYGISETPLDILGPYTGKLANNSDRVAVERPVPAARAGVSGAWAIVDEVTYSHAWPWPEAGPDGAGLSLQRDEQLTGCAPGNWLACLPTPGLPSSAESTVDFDMDDLPDRWETANGLNPQDPLGDNGPEGDPDLDGLDNRTEFSLGTVPFAVTLRFSSFHRAETGVVASFIVPGGFAVGVEVCDALGTTWETVADFLPEPNPRHIDITLPLAQTTSGGRFWRLTGTR